MSSICGVASTQKCRKKYLLIWFPKHVYYSCLSGFSLSQCIRFFCYYTTVYLGSFNSLMLLVSICCKSFNHIYCFFSSLLVTNANSYIRLFSVTVFYSGIRTFFFCCFFLFLCCFVSGIVLILCILLIGFTRLWGC